MTRGETAMRKNQELEHRLPKVRGRYSFDADLSRVTWFRVGGLAQVVFKPADSEDLSFFLKACPKDIPLFCMGVGSNLLVRDGGIQGVVIRLGNAFSHTLVNDEEIDVGAGCLDRNVALVSANSGLEGLEFLAGIPGTMGGALRMNAGAYGSEIKDYLVSAMAMDRSGEIHTLPPQEMGFSYRHCSIPEDWIFIGARLKARRAESAEAVKEKISQLLTERDLAQPTKSRTGGSTFRNPDGKKAWQLIDEAGCRGMMKGGAQVSEKHCNFLINTGTATAQDLESLADDVRARVLTHSGEALIWEIRRIGDNDCLGFKNAA
ncbi:MAG: UDP-N-acetylmuramate dehydrogenase [bacterium]|nr:UDP-N-acetylmuramate dehydrogenase [bacterium]